MPANATSRKARPVRRKSPREPRALPRVKAIGSLFVTALDFSDDEAAVILRRMLSIRRVDEALVRLARRGQSPTQSTYPAAGCEAVAVGACSVLASHDLVLGDEWRHGLIIARCGDIRAAIAEWTPDPTPNPDSTETSTSSVESLAEVSPSTGRGDDSPRVDVLNGGMAVAVGAGLACRWNKQGQAALCFCSPGDQAQGRFHESLSLAVNWKLPLVFIFPEIEVARGSGEPRVFMQAKAYGVEGVLCDGSSVADVRAAVRTACDRARSGKGPALIEAAIPAAKIARTVNPPPAAIEEADALEPEVDIKALRDPLRIFRNLLMEAALMDDAGLAAIERDVALEVKTALAKPLDSAIPAREILLRNVYKGWVEGRFGLMRDGDGGRTGVRDLG